MKPSTRSFFALLLGAAMFEACSVKEDRTECPCRLNLDFSELDAAVIDSIEVTGIANGEIVLSDAIYAEDFGSEYTALVPRSSLTLAVVSGIDGIDLEKGLMQIPLGSDCPQVYMHVAQIDTYCETVQEKVLLRKNFCRLDLCVEDEDGFPFMFAVKGNVDGYRSDGTPTKGEFYCAAYQTSEGEYRVFLPRQLDSSLCLDIHDGSDVLKTFALGEIMAASGYDWEAPDLKDVTVGIDYSRSEVSISVEGWDKVYVYDFVI